jgi:hypothetical protein
MMQLDWGDTNWKEFREKLQERLDNETRCKNINNMEQFDDTLQSLQIAIQDTIKDCIPQWNITPFTKQ